MTDNNEASQYTEQEQEFMKKLETEIDKTDWTSLEPHYKRGSIFLVSEELKLVEIGLRMAKDESEKVKHWLAMQKMRQVDESEAEIWKEDLNQRFEFLIIQPYVLIKLLENEL